ncbi:MAG: hypothetical protein GTO41_26420, partial [Burkholderiales bacterium]|nr:hypothetical protein [Burkholderiales bacterium]
MAEGRMLKKAVSTSRKLAELQSDSARLLYTWLIPHLDVEGRFSADPAVVKGSVFPRLRHSISRVAALLNELQNAGLIIVYEADGDMYLQLKKFKDFQHLRTTHEAKSKIPPPPRTTAQLRHNDGRTTAKVNLIKVNLSKVNNEGKGTNVPSPSAPDATRPAQPIAFCFDRRKWLNIKVEDKSGWLAAFPACDIELELCKMREWLLANPVKRKKNYRRFITNWLAKTQDRGGSVQEGRPKSRPLTRKDERKKRIDAWAK